MIRCAYDNSDGKRCYVLGLSERNIQALVEQERPIIVKLDELGGQDGTLLIFTGESETQMEFMLRKHGLITENTKVL